MDSYLIVLTLKCPSLRDTSDKDRDILICVFKGNNLHYSTENFSHADCLKTKQSRP